MTYSLKRFRHSAFGCLLGVLVGACGPEAEAETTPPLSQLTDKDWSASGYQKLLPKAVGDPQVFATFINPDLSRTPDLKTLAGIAMRMGVGFEQDFEAAEKLLSEACDAGQMRACRELGQVLIESNQQSRYAEAAALLLKSCESGIELSCGDLVRVFVDGIGVSADAAAALGYAKRVCSAPESDNCADAAKSLIAADTSESLALLAVSCEAGNMLACHWSGHYRLSGEDRSEYELGITHEERACAAGFVYSCEGVFMAKVKNRAEPSDLDFAVKAVEAECARGYVRGCYMLMRAFSSEEGSTMTPDPARVFQYTLTACGHGDPEACRWTAEKYEAGDGVPANAQGALAIYQQLCTAGNQRMCQQAARVDVSLSPSFATAQPTDIKRAVMERACEIGDGEACRGIGWLYVLGEEGRTKDPALAAAHFEAGCAKGAANACIDIGSLNDWAEHGFTENKAVASAYYQRACNLGEPLGCELQAQWVALNP